MKNIYTPVQDASQLVQERNADTKTQERLLDLLNNAMPVGFPAQTNPVAMLMRYVARGTVEDVRFANFAAENGLTPFWATYIDDKFTTRNPEKVETVRPPLLLPKGQRTRAWIVKPEARQGSVGKLETIYGMEAQEYQAGLRRAVLNDQGLGGYTNNVFDMSGWYRAQATRLGYESGSLAASYYLATMILSTSVVMVEDFDGGPNAAGGDLARFKCEVVEPAFERAEAMTGLRPIIVQLPYQSGMNETDLRFLDMQQVRCLQEYGTIGGDNE